MKNIRKIVAAALVSVLVVGATGCNMITKTEAGVKKSPVAKFNNTTITKGELDEKMAPALEQLKAQYGENFKNDTQGKEAYAQAQQEFLDNMILEKIITKKADEKKITVEDKEITDKIEELKKAYTEDQIKSMGYKDGYNDAEFKATVKNIVMSNKLYEDTTKDVTVDDAKAQEFYNSNQSSFTEKPNTIKLAHILVATEDEAKKVKERVDNKEDFGKLAKELSTDTGSKDNAGEYEVPVVNSGFDPTFMAAALALKTGEVSAPIQTQHGWHIIKSISKTDYPVKKFDDVKEDIKKQLLDQAKQAKMNETVEQWKTDAKIKKYDKNLNL
ncbi:peptidylprolyl isomerase [Clostridium swellfunianum]|uniref:peptidylprolyl isomerase n=1 Tax=Clostridium swellfunianum TaxID=1367462 RepID=UPI0020301B7E|nr:peptidylprolyl isomerase [Clostridium swellfunianum]